MDHSISYDPRNLFEDVQSSVYELHVSEKIHNEIVSDMGEWPSTHS